MGLFQVASNHFILDYETLSQDATRCAAIDCSYVVFDWDRFTSRDDPYTFEELLSQTHKAKFDVTDQVKRHSFVIDKSTLDWWSTQGPAARNLLKPSLDDITIEKFFSNLTEYLERHNYIKYWWSRSNTFDPVILWQQASKCGMSERIGKLLPHWKIRDTRTFIDAKTNFSMKSNGFCPLKNEDRWNEVFVQHSSRHDIVADVLRLQTLVRLEKDLDILE